MSARERPNVVLVITDDQGYADLGCTGNPWLQTPYIDAFSREAVRCNDFHVSPLCTPTRGGIMSGRRPVRNGAWATAWGRSILPTFIELCGLVPPRKGEFDGMSVAPLLRGQGQELPERIHFVQYRQNTDPPEKWTNAVMTRRWRLVGGTELYDIQADPGQERDVAAEYPQVVARLRAAHEGWWTEIAPGLDKHCLHILGNDHENPTRLDAMDVRGDIAWDQPHVRAARKSTGTWAVEVERAGRYRFALRRWPAELGLPIDAVPEGEDGPGQVNSPALNRRHGASGVDVALHPCRAEIRIGNCERAVEVETGAREAVGEFDLEPLEGTLDAWFVDESGERQGAYYVYVERR